MENEEALTFEDELTERRWVEHTEDGVVFKRDQVLDSDPREIPLSFAEVERFIDWYNDIASRGKL